MGKPTLPPYTLQVLTSEYCIEGTVPGDTLLTIPEPHSNRSPYHFLSVKVQLTRSAEVKTYFYKEFFLNPGAALALIPHLDITQHPSFSGWKLFRVPLTGVFHLGPYCMSGRLMTTGSGYLSGDNPAFDVRFTSLYPGSQWGELSAPFALVGITAVHGWAPGL